MARHALTGILLAAAGGVLWLTTAQGLVAVLVLIAACGTATWSGRWAGVGVGAGAGVVFVIANILLGRTTGIGVLLTLVAVCMWAFLAWAAGVTADERRRINDLLVQRALHDALTGLANRDLLIDRLEHALHRSRRHTGHVAVIFIDLDDFKSINDTMGHAAGDAVLTELAQRLMEQLRDSDTAARLGGDEFAVVCEDLHNEEEAMHIAMRLMDTWERPFHHDGHDFLIQASLGIAVATSATQSAEELLRQADEAMYRVKHQRDSWSAKP